MLSFQGNPSKLRMRAAPNGLLGKKKAQLKLAL